MRVDPNYLTNLADSLDQAQVTEQQLTAELSSGRASLLSQDPVSSGENVLLLNQIQQDDSFTQSASLVTGSSRWAIRLLAASSRSSRRPFRWPPAPTTAP